MAYLEMSNITKIFPGVKALDKVNFSLDIGEIHTLVGENGAGKSTLVKVLAGAHKRNTGDIKIDGKKAKILSPKDAMKLKIFSVQQHYSLQPNMTVAENIKFGNYPASLGMISWKKVVKETADFVKELGFDEIDVKKKVYELSVAEGQIVEIVKALYRKPKILIMDEPSAVLPKNDLDKLHNILQKIKKDIGIIYISHHFEEIFKISDRITVLKDGKNVDVVKPSDIDEDELCKMMVGRDIGDMYPSRENHKNEEIVMNVENLSTKKVYDINFNLKRGEILGIAGLVGAGRTELCEALFGLDPLIKGKISLENKEIHNRSPRKSISHGFGFVTEDRHKTGLILPMTVKKNISLVGYKKISKLTFVDGKKDKNVAKEYIDKLKIMTPTMNQLAEYLSGGNQQKVVLSKWLFSGADVLLLDEPTRGIDVGTKAEIYKLMKDLTKKGMSIIMVSSELPEIIGMSDRILVMHKGKIAGELYPEQTSEEEILAYAAGLKNKAIN